METVELSLRLPVGIHRKLTQSAEIRSLTPELALVDLLQRCWNDGGLETDDEKRDLVASAIEATDWWDTKRDRQWDEWSP